MRGIDISEHNGTIDFKKLKSQIDFVILRIGWIGNNNNHTLDKKFDEYLQGCKQNSIPIGIYVYNYCKTAEKAKEGSKWVIEQIEKRNLRNYIQYPIFIDMEDSTIINCGKINLTNQCLDFCKEIEKSGFKAGIYANKNWFLNYLDINKLITYKIWLAEWNNKSNHTANFKVDLWQYTSNGSVEGITGRVDLNKCLNCQKLPVVTEKQNESGVYNMKIYQNGSTKEPVFQESSCQTQIGYLNPYEKAECYGEIDGKALVVYNVDNKNYKKVGFCKWLGGIK